MRQFGYKAPQIEDEISGEEGQVLGEITTTLIIKSPERTFITKTSI